MRAPPPQGLYDPAFERDGCGMGFVAHIKGARSNEIIAHGLRVLANLDHRGGVGADPTLGGVWGCAAAPDVCRVIGNTLPAVCILLTKASTLGA